jgi:hypothetical protein
MIFGAVDHCDSMCTYSTRNVTIVIVDDSICELQATPSNVDNLESILFYNVRCRHHSVYQTVGNIDAVEGCKHEAGPSGSWL